MSMYDKVMVGSLELGLIWAATDLVFSKVRGRPLISLPAPADDGFAFVWLRIVGPIGAAVASFMLMTVTYSLDTLLASTVGQAIRAVFR